MKIWTIESLGSVSSPLKLIAPVLCAVALLGASSAWSYVDDSPLGRQNYEENYLTQLHFRTPGRGFLFNFDFSPEVYNQSANYVNGNETSHVVREHFPIDLTGTIGITDLISFQVSEGYLFHSVTKSTDSNSGSLTTSGSSGMSDPHFKLDYRYYGGLSGPTFADAFIDFSPSMGDNQITGSLQDGNFLRGGTTLEIGTDLFQVAGANEVSVGGSWIYNASKNYDSGNPMNDEVGDNYSTFNLRLKYRYHFNEFVYGQLQGTFTMPSSPNYSYQNLSNSQTESDSYPFYVTPGVSLGGLLSNSSLISANIFYAGVTRNSTVSNNNFSNQYTSVLHQATVDLRLTLLY